MKWSEALDKIDKPTLTNREAAGLVQFARAVYNAHSKGPAKLTRYDWYTFALPALGWSKSGDKFKVDTEHQLQPYPETENLRAALHTLAAELDAAGVAFKLARDPRGTDAVYRQLAKDAWAAMQQLGAYSGYPAERVYDPNKLAPDGAMLDEAAAAAKKKKAAAAALNVLQQAKNKKKPEPEQLDLPHTMQPVGEPIRAPQGNGGGGAILLLLLFAASSGRKRNGRR